MGTTLKENEVCSIIQALWTVVTFGDWVAGSSMAQPVFAVERFKTSEELKHYDRERPDAIWR
jgi:hypothetical protein